MRIIKKDINKILTFFLFSHLMVWVLIPSISNNNLPLDTIEHLAWASNLSWGFDKHPPLVAFILEIFYKIFGNQDWAYYFLSQIFVIFSFYIVWLFSRDFFKDGTYSLIAVLLLEGVYFYNFTTPEFNVNVCQLPFWALSVLFCWRSIKNNKVIDWLLFGLFAGLGVLSKYLFIYLLLSIDVFFIYLFIKRKINYKCFLSLITFFLVLLPHLIWLTENNYSTISYALHRTGVEETNLLNHFTHPFLFLLKQIGILLPFFILLLFIISKLKTKVNFSDKKFIFLFTINIIPLSLIFLTSLFMGVKIRTMWMTPFYLFAGVFVVYVFYSQINLKKMKEFIFVFLFLFTLAPAAYFYISLSEINKRTDYPGKKIATIVQKKWDDNFINKIGLVGGDEWHGGNLSYHLKSRPKWDNILESKNDILLDDNKNGFILIGDASILSKICGEIFFEIENQGVCMFGESK